MPTRAIGVVLAVAAAATAASACARTRRTPDDTLVMVIEAPIKKGHELIAQARFAAMDLALTISVGVATYPRPELESRQDLVEAADQALYRAKRSGKNRLVQYGV